MKYNASTWIKCSIQRSIQRKFTKEIEGMFGTRTVYRYLLIKDIKAWLHSHKYMGGG